MATPTGFEPAYVGLKAAALPKELRGQIPSDDLRHVVHKPSDHRHHDHEEPEIGPVLTAESSSRLNSAPHLIRDILAREVLLRDVPVQVSVVHHHFPIMAAATKNVTGSASIAISKIRSGVTTIPPGLVWHPIRIEDS